MQKAIFVFATLLGFSGCTDKSAGSEDTGEVRPGDADLDGDGWTPEDGDCDDDDAKVHPDAPETCNGADDNCDGEIDEGLETWTWFADVDGDGYGSIEITECAQPEQSADVGGDCDDADADVNPDADEVCDGVDNDCDGDTDEDAADAETWYADADADGYGDPDAAVSACEAATGYTDDATDCDDGDAAVNPAAVEVCDDIDNDCDGDTDEDDAADAATWYADADADGFGDASAATAACAAPEGYTDDATDCDDTSAAVNSDAVEVCDGADNDCDGDTDEDAADADTWYADADADGYGDPDSADVSCEAATGYIADATDCDDTSAAVNPAAVEVCDDIDNDCDGATDEDDAADADTWYADADSDGYGDPATTDISCEPGPGYVSDATDCDDGDGDVNPDATEVCDDIDNDCDGAADEDDAADADTWYADADSDGFGDADNSDVSCEAATGYVADATDCDDGDDDVNPDADEVCDGADNDCDGADDEGLDQTWYLDSDGDGYGDDDTTAEACAAPSGSYISVGGDCDDDDDDAYPGATETWYDGVDADCLGDGDYDADGDGYDSDSYGGDDCDDSDASVMPEDDGSCASGESCAGLLDAGYTADGTYTIDPDGHGTGLDPYDVECDMTTDGGGWTLVADWNAEDDGDTLSDFTTLMTEEINTMDEWTDGGTYIQWSDYDVSADMLSFALDISFPNGGEVMTTVDYYGYSLDDAAVYFYVEAGGAYEDIICQEAHWSYSDFISAGFYSSSEYAYRPYVCANQTSQISLTIDETYEDDFGAEVTGFYITSFHHDSTHGDYSRLYDFEVWVR